MAHTLAETSEMLDLVTEHLNDPGNASTLTAKGLGVDATQTRLTSEKDNLAQLDAKQEELKVSLQNKAKVQEAATAAGYIDSNGMVDAIAGLCGMNIPAGKEIPIDSAKLSKTDVVTDAGDRKQVPDETRHKEELERIIAGVDERREHENGKR